MSIILDFLLLGVFGAMLVGVFVFLRSKIPDNRSYRLAVGVALVALFLLFWINGAVGMIGSGENDANMMYAGVAAVGIVGALWARFRPMGMARAMFATALAQVLVAVIAVSLDLGSSGPIWPRDLWALTGIFSSIWVGSALLFLSAARQEKV